MLGYVIHNSSQRVAFRAERLGCQKVAYHRMLVGGLEVVKCAKR